MNQLAILRRHLAILRLVQPPFTYPAKSKILDRLQNEDLESVSKRTFERDIKEIESYYGIRVEHSRRHKGYFLNQPEDEDLSNFQQFFQLLERSERLAFLTNSTDALRTSRYLQLEENTSPENLEHLPVLWEALRRQQQIAFEYQSFQAAVSKSYKADPVMLLEYRNRWYLAAWDTTDRRFKTYGLECMRKPRLTTTPIEKDRQAEFLELKQSALGVFVGPENAPVKVKLRISPIMAPYIKSVPIHASQNILIDDETGLLLELHIVTNHELEAAILGFGEHVEVLEPESLRQKIQSRALALVNQYSKATPA